MTISDPLRPNQTVSNQWSIGDHTDINEDITQPTKSDEVVLGANEEAGDDNEVVVVAFPNTIDDVDEATNIRVWSLGLYTSADPQEIDVNCGGWQGIVNCNIGFALYEWTYNDFGGSFSQADIDGLQVKYIADCPDKYFANAIDVCYILVTYSQVVVGYTASKPLGIPTVKIGKVLGIASADIGKIKGI